MTRNLTALAVCGVLALTGTSCTNGHGGAKSGGHDTARPAGAVERPQEAGLVLSAGRSSAQYRITAPSPARYGFDVTIVAPASADVAVNIRTWYGQMLSILPFTRGRQESCKRRGSQHVCFERFPLLPAQRAGTWTVTAAKRSEPAAKVHIAVTFAKP